MSKQSKLIVTVQVLIVVAAAVALVFAPWWMWSTLLAVDVLLSPDTRPEDD